MSSQPAPIAQMDHGRAPDQNKHGWVQEDLVCSSNNCDFSGTCWLSWCCSPCLFQRNYNRYKYLAENDQNVDIDAKCGWCCTFQCCLTGWAHFVLPTVVRGKIRDHRRISGSPLGDCCATACCLPCSLIQEAHEMDDQLGNRGGSAKH